MTRPAVLLLLLLALSGCRKPAEAPVPEDSVFGPVAVTGVPGQTIFSDGVPALTGSGARGGSCCRHVQRGFGG